MSIYRHSSRSSWQASIIRGGKNYYLGSFPTKERAQAEWDKAAERIPRSNKGRRSLAHPRPTQAVKVIDYDGGYIGEFRSEAIAAKELECLESSVRKVLNGKQKYAISKRYGCRVTIKKLDK